MLRVTEKPLSFREFLPQRVQYRRSGFDPIFKSPAVEQPRELTPCQRQCLLSLPLEGLLVGDGRFEFRDSSGELFYFSLRGIELLPKILPLVPCRLLADSSFAMLLPRSTRLLTTVFDGARIKYARKLAPRQRQSLLGLLSQRVIVGSLHFKRSNTRFQLLSLRFCRAELIAHLVRTDEGLILRISLLGFGAG